MTRINVYEHDEIEGSRLAGWFDIDTAEQFSEITYWNGNRSVSVHAGDEFDHQILYRTKGGRWVLHCWSQWQGRQPSYEFIDGAQARDWLLRNEDDDAVQRFFGEIEEERGPGRPEVGKPINVRLGDELLDRVDAEAKRRGTSRADTIRDLIAAALD